VSDQSRRKTVVPAAPGSGVGIPSQYPPAPLPDRERDRGDRERTGPGALSVPRRAERVRAGAGATEMLAFVLGNEVYALPLATVREILKPPAITEVPRASRDVLGIISVRGRVTTVIDLRRRLKMPEAPTTRLSRVLLVEGGEEVLGLLVDNVHHVHRLRDDEIELATTVSGGTAEYVLGIGRPRGVKDDILILLDPEPLLRR
jgi:purine-binding chemotaxis protein CheW